jgi:hypothetical protein
MVKLNRRKTILGMGLLAAGSGAAFTSASFTNSVDADADMRVVAAESLTVQPGISFRDGSSPGDPYDTALDGTTISGANFYSESNNDFFAATSPQGGQDEELGTDLAPGDLPAISVTNAEDGNLLIKTATLNNASTITFEEALQVRNDGDTSKQVGVKFAKFGVDTTGDQDSQGGGVDEAEVVDAYSFLDSGSNRISTDDQNFRNNTISAPSDQVVDNVVTINPGNVQQIDIEVDLSSTIVSQIATASSATGDPFQGDHDTVQLVDTIKFGNDPDSTT